MSNDISVIIPTHNRPEYLELAIKSACKQTLKPKEIIVIDDYSDIEYAKEICFQYGARYIKIHHVGTSGAINEGVIKAKGPWIKYLSDDDFLEPDALENLINTAERTKAQIIYAHYYIVNESGDTIRKFIEPKYKTQLEFYFAIWDHHIGNTSSSLIHKDVFRKVGLFDEKLKMAEEYDFFLRASLLHNFSFELCDKPTVNYRVHEAQKTYEKASIALSEKEKIRIEIDKTMMDYTPHTWEAFKIKAKEFRARGFKPTVRSLWHERLLKLDTRVQVRILRNYLKFK